MSLTEAVRSVLTQYAVFSGRARRSEFWYWALTYTVVLLVAGALDQIWDSPIAVVLATLALLVPTLAVTWRRLHDTGRSGAWYFLALVPFGGIVVLVFMVMDSQPMNQYGPSPKAIEPAVV